jgi:hypothetical protein
VPEGTPPTLVRTLARMLEPDPDKRASSVAEALEQGGARVSSPPSRKSERKEERRAIRESERDERKARKALRRERAHTHRRAPFLVWTLAGLAILVARVAVWAAVGVVTPVALVLLSMIFGASLRRAATRCSEAAGRANARMKRAERWLAGKELVGEDEPPEAWREEEKKAKKRRRDP